MVPKFEISSQDDLDHGRGIVIVEDKLFKLNMESEIRKLIEFVYDLGERSSLTKGYNWGFQNGYEEGYDEGHKDGYGW